MVIVSAAKAAHFAAGGDIEEFPSFRFDEQRLRHFHEDDVAPALRAMLDCDVPVVAQIDGACIGGGLEIAACCDLRICGAQQPLRHPDRQAGLPAGAGARRRSSARVLGLPLLRELLLEARLLGADEALARGIVQPRRRRRRGGRRGAGQRRTHRRAVAAGAAHQQAHAAPAGRRRAQRRRSGIEHFGYADSAEHREGLAAFVEKRAARF